MPRTEEARVGTPNLDESSRDAYSTPVQFDTCTSEGKIQVWAKVDVEVFWKADSRRRGVLNA